MPQVEVAVWHLLESIHKLFDLSSEAHQEEKPDGAGCQTYAMEFETLSCLQTWSSVRGL
jgi:hypothetical protein